MKVGLKRNHALKAYNQRPVSLLEVAIENVVNEYLDLAIFVADIGISWFHRFESTKIRVMKVYPILVSNFVISQILYPRPVLLLHHL